MPFWKITTEKIILYKIQPTTVASRSDRITATAEIHPHSVGWRVLMSTPECNHQVKRFFQTKLNKHEFIEYNRKKLLN